jgi:hypothetical protein
MMSKSPSFCGMCDNLHISKSSEVWCRDCEEGFCTECIEYHSSWKLSRGHTVSLFCLILPIVSIISLIKCSVSLNILDVFTFFIMSSMITTFLQSLWFFTLQILQHGHSCSLQYKLNFSWCSLQCSLIFNTYDGTFD